MDPGFPTTPGAFQPRTSHPCGFVGRLTPDASTWVWCSCVGVGNIMRDMTIDDEGNVYGVLDYYAESKEVLPEGWFANAFCKKPHAGKVEHFGHSDAGVIEITTGGKVEWASWIGATNGNDMIASVAVGKDHCPAIMLNTGSADMPTTPGAFCKSTPDQGAKATFAIPRVGGLSADGSKLLFGTYLGVWKGAALARTHNLAVDAQGNVFATFQAQGDAPVTSGALQTKFGGKSDARIEGIPTGALLAARYVGGSGDDSCSGPDEITLDRDGNVVIACCTSSTDYPVTTGASQPGNAGAGGRHPFDGAGCCFGTDGRLYVGGVTTSRDFPVRGAFQGKYAGDPDFGLRPGGGQFPVGWGNGDCWFMKLGRR